MSTNRLIKCGKEFKGNGGGDGRKGGAARTDDENSGSLREVELKKKCVHSDGFFGIQNGTADDNIGCDIVNRELMLMKILEWRMKLLVEILDKML